MKDKKYRFATDWLMDMMPKSFFDGDYSGHYTQLFEQAMELERAFNEDQVSFLMGNVDYGSAEKLIEKFNKINRG